MLLSTPPPSRLDLEVQNRETWIRHNEIMVLFHDYSGLAGQEAIDICEILSERVRKRGLFGLVLLVDVSGGQADRETLSVFKRETAANKPYFKKIAVIGVEGVLAFFFHIVKNFAGVRAKAFDTREQALDWLVEKE